MRTVSWFVIKFNSFVVRSVRLSPFCAICCCQKPCKFGTNSLNVSYLNCAWIGWFPPVATVPQKVTTNCAKRHRRHSDTQFDSSNVLSGLHRRICVDIEGLSTQRLLSKRPVEVNCSNCSTNCYSKTQMVILLNYHQITILITLSLLSSSSSSSWQSRIKRPVTCARLTTTHSFIFFFPF